MPSRLRKHDAIPIDSVQLDGGDWVRMRRFLTAEDRDQMNAKLVELDLVSGEGKMDVTVANRATLMMAIVEWGGPGFCTVDHEDDQGNPLPIEDGHVHESVPLTFEAVSVLRDNDMMKLLQKLKSGRPNPLVANGRPS